MNKSNTNIDKLVSKILNEEIESKVKQLTEDWTEVETKESLKGGQNKLDVAEPKGKLTAADFKKLRSKKKETKESEEMDEWFYFDKDGEETSTPGDYEGDDDAEDEAEELSNQEPTYVGKGLKKPKMMGSFDDEHGWFDEHDSLVHPDDLEDYDEEEFHDVDSLLAKHGKNQKWFAPMDGEKFFKSYQDKFGGKPFRVRTARGLDEQEMDEFFFDDDSDNEFDDSHMEHQHRMVNKSGKKPSMMGSFDDEHGWFDNNDRQVHPDDMEDYDEEEFHDVDSLLAKHGKNQKWFAPKGDKFFNQYKDKFGGKPFRVRTARDMDEAETEEGNAFSGALANAKKHHKDSFEVDGHKYPVKEGKEKWIQKTGMKKGALHKKLGVAEGDKIPQAKLKSLKKELMKKGEGDKKLSAADAKLLKQVNLALTLKGIKENKDSLKLTENELIDLIERLVVEQKVKDKAEKDNISKKQPEGLKKTIKAQDVSKKENDDYAKEVVKKMKDYVKAGSKGEYTESPESFPESNYNLEKNPKVKKYMPSDAVEEYIEYFSYPGQTNIVYDEIKPEDERIEKYLKGHRTTGNAEVDEEGNALGNVVPSGVGEKFMKNYKDNVYGAEQMKASYKRQPQPVETAGETKNSGHLKLDKGTKVLNKLEESKEVKMVNEEMNKMKNLISYSRKTQ
jgi:hypothetical protein